MKNRGTDLETIQNELRSIEAELCHSPAGRLVKKGTSYVQVLADRQSVITQNPDLIQQLARKKYLLTRKTQLTHNFKLVTRYDSKADTKNTKELITELAPTYKNLPITYFYHPTIHNFLTTPYPPNTYPSSRQTYTSNGGTIVRSKSEVLIANRLEAYNVPYRYEIPIVIGGKQKYPDFTIKHPFTGKTVIWEHFGALHEPGYEKKMIEKMNLYQTHGYLPFETLIYTFEFDLRRIDQIIAETILG